MLGMFPTANIYLHSIGSSHHVLTGGDNVDAIQLRVTHDLEVVLQRRLMTSA